MSSRGRKPKPSIVKDLQGNPGKRARNVREPKPATAVKKPRGMSRGGKRFFDEHAAELERIKLLTGVDVPAFRLMAEHYTLALWALKELHSTGLTVEGRYGPKKNPLAQIAKDNAMLFKSFATEFGMTPSSRSRMQMPDDAEQLSLVEQLFAAVNDVVDAEG